MGVFMDYIKKRAKKWLEIVPQEAASLLIHEMGDYEVNVMRNRIWYRGDPSEIDQFFHQTARDSVTQSRFWASSPSKGMNIRKIHTGLPGMTVRALVNVVTSDYLEIEIGDTKSAGEDIDTWREIEKENQFMKLLSKAVTEMLVTGDGAFKISFDTELSDYPIIEFFSGEYVDYTINRGRVQEVVFYSRYGANKKTFTLAETYGKGYVRYQLLNASGDPVSMDMVPELSGLVDVEYKNADFMMAVPLMIYESPKWEGRGASIFDLKNDDYDALDEIISQWQDAIRLGRIKRYIPETMIPKDPKTGEMMPVNPFDNQFTAMAEPLAENGQSKIQTEQPTIQHEGYLASYITTLDRCLQGIISPSTLGIDTKKLDNAEAQREKEKTTLYSRDKIIDALQEVVPELVNVTLKAYATLKGRPPKDYAVTVSFGEYANPSFEAQVETIGKAANTQIMSIEAQVRELWGDTKEEEWIKEEISRIKAERGIMEVEEPSYVPHGFAPEEDMLDDLDRLGDRPADRDGAGSVLVDAKEPEAPQA